MFSYNTGVVLVGSTLLGASTGLIGTFAVLRRRALTSDALAHAALPGICLAFWAFQSRSLPILLAGAFLSGMLAIGTLVIIRQFTRVKEDAALGVVLTTFFGAGIVLSRLLQNRVSSVSKAGLDSFLFGKTSGMLAEDLGFLAGWSLCLLVCVVLLFKEFELLSFDIGFARAQGFPVNGLDLGMMALIAIATVVGLPIVGVVLMAGLLVLPASTARLWTERLPVLLGLSGLIGAASCTLGTLISSAWSGLPTGPVIVLTGTAAFLVSLVIAPRRGLLAKALELRSVRNELANRQLLVAVYERLCETPEPRSPLSEVFTVAELAVWMCVPVSQASRLARRAARAGWFGNRSPARAVSVAVATGVVAGRVEAYAVTPTGYERMRDVVRQERIWTEALRIDPSVTSELRHLADVADAQRLPRVLVEHAVASLQKSGRWPGDSP